MNKSYKCDFCAHDTPPHACPKEACVGCVKGSNFEMKERMSLSQAAQWATCQRMVNMTNKEAADFIKKSMLSMMVSRANGKAMMSTALSIALTRAIDVLENTPD